MIDNGIAERGVSKKSTYQAWNTSWWSQGGVKVLVVNRDWCKKIMWSRSQVHGQRTWPRQNEKPWLEIANCIIQIRGFSCRNGLALVRWYEIGATVRSSRWCFQRYPLLVCQYLNDYEKLNLNHKTNKLLLLTYHVWIYNCRELRGSASTRTQIPNIWTCC